MQPLSPRHTAARAARAARDNSYGRSSLRGGEWVGGSEDLDDDEGVRGVSPAGNRGGLNGQAAGEEVLGADGGPLMDTLSSRYVGLVQKHNSCACDQECSMQLPSVLMIDQQGPAVVALITLADAKGELPSGAALALGHIELTRM